MSLQQRIQALENRKPSELEMVRFVRFVSAAGEPREPLAFTDHAGWRCDRDRGESSEAHQARARAAARLGCAGRVVLFAC
jgi:hypothetical protein